MCQEFVPYWPHLKMLDSELALLRYRTSESLQPSTILIMRWTNKLTCLNGHLRLAENIQTFRFKYVRKLLDILLVRRHATRRVVHSVHGSNSTDWSGRKCQSIHHAMMWWSIAHCSYTYKVWSCCLRSCRWMVTQPVGSTHVCDSGGVVGFYNMDLFRVIFVNLPQEI